MRILYISNSSKVSGAPSALVNMVSVLRDRHEIAVVLPDASGPLHEKLTAIGVKCYCDVPYGLTIWPRVICPVKYMKRLYSLTVGLDKARTYVGKVIDEFRPDIVHTNAGPVDIALGECRKRGIPHVWHIREFQSGMRFWPSRSEFISRIHSFGNWNIAITRSVYDYWRLRDNDKVIYDGVRLPEGEVSFRNPEGGYFLFAGRIEKNKGVHELLKAYRMYRRAGGKALLKIAGRPSLLYGLRCRIYSALAGLSPYVVFLGQHDDLPGLMRNALALTVCSRTEGFGLVSVEAMLEGCLVIGNDTTGMKEQFDIGLKHTGQEIGLRYRGAAQLADALGKVSAGSMDFMGMRERAFATVRDMYELDGRIAELENHYKRILEEKS